MIYPALVLDNSSFLQKGTIRVRIANFFMETMKWNILEDVSMLKDGLPKDAKDSREHQDFEAYVFSPIGGGKNFGLFYLPEVNTKGMVAFIGNAQGGSGSCFWMGSILQPTFEKGSLKEIDFPSDKDNVESGFTNGAKNIDVIDGALVLRLKSAKLTDINDPDKKLLDWNLLNTENVVVINKDKVYVKHSSKYDDKRRETEYQTLTITPTETSMAMVSVVDKNIKTSKVSLTSDTTNGLGFELSVSDPENKINSSIVSNKSLTKFYFKNNKDETTIKQTKDTIEVSNAVASVTLDKAGMTLNAATKDINIVAKNIRFNDSVAHILTTTQTGSFELANGMIVTASKTLFGG